MLCPCLPFFSVFFLCFLGTVTKKTQNACETGLTPLHPRAGSPQETLLPLLLRGKCSSLLLCASPREGDPVLELAGTG